MRVGQPFNNDFHGNELGRRRPLRGGRVLDDPRRKTAQLNAAYGKRQPLVKVRINPAGVWSISRMSGRVSPDIQFASFNAFRSGWVSGFVCLAGNGRRDLFVEDMDKPGLGFR